MLACALIPRFALLATLGGRRQALLSRPLALAPEPGGPQVVGEASGPAEAFGVRAGMRLGEALARCPELALVPPDPERAEAAWEEALVRLEGIGAAVEPGRPGEAFFEAAGLRGLWGGSLEGVLRRARKAIGPPVRLGAGQTRLCAYAAALQGEAAQGAGDRPRGDDARLSRPPAGRPAPGSPHDRAAPGGGAGRRRACRDLPEKLERLGVDTLGQLAALPDAAIADRFGEAGLRALRMARGAGEPLRPRRAPEELVERLELPEAISGQQLERALTLLVDRLLARPERRGRSLRRLRLGARLAGAGAGARWRRCAAPAPIRAPAPGAAPEAGWLPGPAALAELRALATGPPASDQATLDESARGAGGSDSPRRFARRGRSPGRTRCCECSRSTSGSRVPERRSLLTPFTYTDDSS